MTIKAIYRSILSSLVFLALFCLVATAQTSPPPLPSQATPPAQTTPPAKPTPPVPATPTMGPDQKAYTEAMALKDPDKKIEALEKFMNDYPDSPGISLSHRGIFDTLVKSHPDQIERIREAADRAISKASSEAMKASYYNAFGTQLFDAGILLDDAEKYLSKGIELNEAQARRSRAPYQATLGRIYIKQGKLSEAGKYLQEALAANPQLSAASLGMAELYEKRGDAGKALTFYVNAAATSKMPTAARQRLEALYAKSHRNSLDGLEGLLDAKYREINPPPFVVERYQPAERRTDRVVLAEVFTGSGCPPCVAADLAADLAMERYGRGLTVLMYHEHIPQPDPMTTAQTTARFRYYKGTGVPTLVIDGERAPGGGGARDATKSVYGRITKAIEKKLEAASRAQLKLDVLLDGGIVRANAVVSQVTSDAPDLKLLIVLVEEMLRYTGENGVRFHPMVVRSIAGTDSGSQGLNITSKDSQTFAWDFNLDSISAGIKKNLDDYENGRTDGYKFNEKKHQIDPKGLVVVAFVQEENTKAVLQSIMVRLNSKAIPQ